MSFAKINLSSYREDIVSGKEVDHKGTRIYKHPRGSVGRAINDFKKIQYRSDELPTRIEAPKPRSKKAIEHFHKENPDVWSGRRQDVEYEQYDYKQDEYIPSNNFPKSFNAWIGRVQKRLDKETRNMPLFILRCMDRFTTPENIMQIAIDSDTRDMIIYESQKNSAYMEGLVVSCFLQTAQRAIAKYHQLVQIARDLGRLSLEEIEENNPYGFEMPVKPILPGSGRSLDPEDERTLEKEIFEDACRFLRTVFERKVEKDITAQHTLEKHFEQPKPISGFGKTKFRVNENMPRDSRRIIARRIQPGQDPRTLFDIDPDSLTYDPSGNVMRRSLPNREYMLPKRERERIFKRLGKIPPSEETTPVKEFRSFSIED